MTTSPAPSSSAGQPAAQGQRRSARPGEPTGPGVEFSGGLWRLRSLEPSRQVLRSRHKTTQAGFTAEYIPQGRLEHRPILIADGPQHDAQRSEVARFFAPAVVRQRYGDDIAACADRLLDGLSGAGGFALDDLALWFTVEVTAGIVGLTHPPRRRPWTRANDPEAAQRAHDRRVRAMSRRLVAFFDQPPFDLSRKDLGRSIRQWMQAARKGLAPIITYHLADVRPAIRERRRRPTDDLIGQLVTKGWSTPDILIEAITYGTAGMVTTREFIVMAAWHLLTNPLLAARYTAAGDEERLAILQEVIRLEPVVGHLYRRVHEEVVITDRGVEHHLAPGDLVDIDVRCANADLDTVPGGGASEGDVDGPGDEPPLSLCPMRRLPAGVRPTVLTFGDGAHKCPGEPLALLEADVLLTRLLARGGQLVCEPDLGWDDLVSGYELRGMRVVLDA